VSAEGAPDAPALRVIDAGASPEEVAAIVAAVTAALAPSAAPVEEPEPVSGWITASRLAARGASASRGDWRRSGRIGGRGPT
jgi:Acyl-CoA carboxylase epsilon subunit